MPVPRSLNGRFDEWFFVSAAARVSPVPFAPAVPTAATVMFSALLPISNRMLSPTEMLPTDETLMLVEPADAGAASRAWAPAMPTAVTVPSSSRLPYPMAILWPTVKPAALVTGTLVEWAGMVIGPSGTGCHSGVLAVAADPWLTIAALWPLPEESTTVAPLLSSNL